ncbi:MAG: hypothetical protein ACK5MJ_04840 [Alphaproteobacteria bacterium]
MQPYLRKTLLATCIAGLGVSIPLAHAEVSDGLIERFYLYLKLLLREV